MMPTLQKLRILKKSLAVLAWMSVWIGAAEAADTVSTAAASPVLSVFKTLLGLLVVLAVMAGVAWMTKRLAGRSGASHSVARIVGGVSVGTRERVVVVEVGKRWLVVGVAAGSVSAIANLSQEDYAPLTNHDQMNTEEDETAEATPQGFAAQFKESLSRVIKSGHA